jgi:hypothetical protein
VRNFLRDGDKVKLTIMFRGRELVHQEYGRKLLDRMAEELKELAIIERMPLVEGRNMIMILSPLNKKHSRGEQRNDKRPPREVQIAAEVVAAEVVAESDSKGTDSNAQDQNS